MSYICTYLIHDVNVTLENEDSVDVDLVRGLGLLWDGG